MTPDSDLVARAGWRPRFHVTGERNWINDPNAPIQHGGVFHLFFQSNPAGPFWGPPVWGHVSSTDLVTWTRQPAALVPSPGGPDADGCWSGCARLVGGHPALYYTGVVGEDAERVESVCRAWGSADLLAWEKDPRNPLIAGPPHGLGYHRDPFLWQDADGGWHMLIGSGSRAGRGQVLRYDSLDGTAWRHGGVFFAAPGLDLGVHWECPQLILDGAAAALIVSCADPRAEPPLMHAVAFTGTVDDGRFAGAPAGRLDAGDVLYAPAVGRDETGRHLLWGWAQERLPPAVHGTLGHAGALTLPRELVLTGDRVLLRPVPELESLREAPLDEAREAERGDRTAAPPYLVAAPQMELLGAFAGAGRPGWTLSDGGSSHVAIHVDLDAPALEVEVADGIGAPRRLRTPLPARAEHTLRAFLDGSLLEVFADDGEAAVTTRAYPSAGAWARIRPLLDPGARMCEIAAWRLRADVIDP